MCLQQFLCSLLNSLNLLRASKFCDGSYSILIQRPDPGIAEIVAIPRSTLEEMKVGLEAAIGNIAGYQLSVEELQSELSECIVEPAYSLLRTMRFAFTIDISQSSATALALYSTTLKLLDLALVAYAGSHATRFDQRLGMNTRLYLPYQTQHRLLVKVQGILENACYEFRSRTIKQVMERERWGCPQAVELNTWVRILYSNQDRFQQADLEGLGKPFAELLDSLSHLRHTAVHRLRVSANGLEQFLVDAETLVQLLQDDNCAKRLTELRRDTQLTIGELKRNKDLLESKLKLKL